MRADEQPHVLERRLTIASARSRCASEPGSCMPVSTSTIPSPAASAQALQCGTPGHGSGRRRRQTPGSTRSPRPSSRLRVGSGIGCRHPMGCGRGRAPAMRRPPPGYSLLRGERNDEEPAMTDVQQAPQSVHEGAIDAEETARVAARLLRRAHAARPRRGRRAVEARRRARTSAARSTRRRPRACARSSSELFGAVPRLRASRSSRRPSQDDRAAVRWRGAAARSPGRARSRASSRPARAIFVEGVDVLIVRDGRDRRERRLRRRHGDRPPARAAAAGRLAGRAAR